MAAVPIDPLDAAGSVRAAPRRVVDGGMVAFPTRKGGPATLSTAAIAGGTGSLNFCFPSGSKSAGESCFCSIRTGQIAALRSTISTSMRIVIFETMNLPEGEARLWFVIDELDALGAVGELNDALARLRKFGGRCLLGFQSIAQVSATYGRGEADTIVENCGNTSRSCGH
jgi:Type IV secretion-system coupling protein DNA-binding domain